MNNKKYIYINRYGNINIKAKNLLHYSYADINIECPSPSMYVHRKPIYFWHALITLIIRSIKYLE